MSTYLTSALFGGAIIVALQLSGLGPTDDPDFTSPRPETTSLARR